MSSQSRALRCDAPSPTSLVPDRFSSHPPSFALDTEQVIFPHEVHSRLHPPTTFIMPLDLSAYPHIFDAILAASDCSILLVWRQTCHAVRDHVGKINFKHLAINFTPSAVGVRAPVYQGPRSPIEPFSLETDVNNHAEWDVFSRTLRPWRRAIDVCTSRRPARHLHDRGTCCARGTPVAWGMSRQTLSQLSTWRRHDHAAKTNPPARLRSASPRLLGDVGLRRRQIGPQRSESGRALASTIYGARSRMRTSPSSAGGRH